MSGNNKCAFSLSQIAFKYFFSGRYKFDQQTAILTSDRAENNPFCRRDLHVKTGFKLYKPNIKLNVDPSSFYECMI